MRSLGSSFPRPVFRLTASAPPPPNTCRRNTRRPPVLSGGEGAKEARESAARTHAPGRRGSAGRRGGRRRRGRCGRRRRSSGRGRRGGPRRRGRPLLGRGPPPRSGRRREQRRQQVSCLDGAAARPICRASPADDDGLVASGVSSLRHRVCASLYAGRGRVLHASKFERILISKFI